MNLYGLLDLVQTSRALHSFYMQISAKKAPSSNLKPKPNCETRVMLLTDELWGLAGMLVVGVYQTILIHLFRDYEAMPGYFQGRTKEPCSRFLGTCTGCGVDFHASAEPRMEEYKTE